MDMMKDTNLKSIISKASTKARAALTDVEFNRLYERVARDLVATVGKDGQIGLEVHLKTKL